MMWIVVVFSEHNDNWYTEQLISNIDDKTNLFKIKVSLII